MWRITYDATVILAYQMNGGESYKARTVADLERLPQDLRDFAEEVGWPDVLAVMDS